MNTTTAVSHGMYYGNDKVKLNHFTEMTPVGGNNTPPSNPYQKHSYKPLSSGSYTMTQEPLNKRQPQQEECDPAKACCAIAIGCLLGALGS